MEERYISPDRVILRTDLVPNSVIECFYKYIEISILTGCWNWTGCLNRCGYGLASGHKIGHKFAHRVSWVLYNGEIPDGMQVCHKCDNRRCCNPDHLFLGTAKDNAEDRTRKGRNNSSFGENNPKSKLTEEDVKNVLKWYAQKVTSKEMCRRLGGKVGARAIRHIVEGKNWKHITRGGGCVETEPSR